MDLTRAAAVAATFDLGDLVRSPAFVARGAMGELWRLETAGGRRWAVKALYEWADDDPFPGDLELQQAAAAVGIRLPTPRLTAEGRAVVDRVRVYEWVDLAPPIAFPADAGTAAEAGRILGTLHALALEPPPGQEVDEWYRTAPSAETFAELADAGDRLDRAWSTELRARLGQLADLSDLVRAAPADADDVVVCHRDFSPSNVFRPAAGGPLVVLDWENAGPMSAEAELAMTVASWIGSSDAGPLVAAYAAAGGTATIRGPSSFASSAATLCNYVALLLDPWVIDRPIRGCTPFLPYLPGLSDGSKRKRETACNRRGYLLSCSG